MKGLHIYILYKMIKVIFVNMKYTSNSFGKQFAFKTQTMWRRRQKTFASKHFKVNTTIHNCMYIQGKYMEWVYGGIFIERSSKFYSFDMWNGCLTCTILILILWTKSICCQQYTIKQNSDKIIHKNKSRNGTMLNTKKVVTYVLFFKIPEQNNNYIV